MFSFILYGGLIRELIMQTCLVSSHQLLLFPLFLTDAVLFDSKTAKPLLNSHYCKC